MTRNDDARLRGDKVLFERGGKLEESRYNHVLTCLTDGAIARVMKHMEPFVDVDGQESLRLSEAGIAAIEKRKKKPVA
jgi:hypothetical protein